MWRNSPWSSAFRPSARDSACRFESVPGGKQAETHRQSSAAELQSADSSGADADAHGSAAAALRGAGAQGVHAAGGWKVTTGEYRKDTWPISRISNLPRPMSAKPRLLLPDTMVIHTAMRLQRWEPLCRAFYVVVPELIAGETKFFDDADRWRTYVTLESAPTAGRHRFTVVQAVGGPAVPDTVQGGEFTLWQAPADEFGRTREMLHPDISGRVHEGEQEAVTYLRLADNPHTIWFVTADVGAIKATVALGFSNCPVSLDAVLKSWAADCSRWKSFATIM